ncbi:MAG TPA: S53 family peptidase [Jatrophihabitantaceae bacterium]
MRRRRITAKTITVGAVLAAALAAVLVAALAASPATAGPSEKTVPNTKPLWTAHATHLGGASASAPVSARVYLAPRGGLAAVKEAAIAMATPGSASYHQFLTPAQYQAQFGTTDATVQAVSSYLTSAGLKVTGVGASNRYVTVKGTVSAAEKAFGAQIERYLHDGHTVQAPASLLKVPGDIAASVLTVSGLDTTPKIVKPASAPPPAGFRNARPCSAYYGEKSASVQADNSTPLPKFEGQTLPYAPCGYTGTQFRSAYEGTTSLDGTGITVAITDAYAAPTIAFDASTYAARHGDRAYAAGQLTQTLPRAFSHAGQCDASGWYGEETLDVEAVHAMAQGANIHYYASASCFDSDFLDTLGKVVDDGTAQLVSNSWGDLEANESPDTVAAYQEVFLQGATEGTSFMFSSGDNGDELASSGKVQADYPTSDPYVTSVGGTSTAIGQSGNLLFQTGWGTEKASLLTDGSGWTSPAFLYGAGGGTSTLFERPDYQDGVTSSSQRQDPDVAMDADPTTGMLVGETQKFPKGVIAYDEYRIGGTSLASPLFAGMTALSLQHAASHGAGLLNPVIYGHAGAFNDVKGSPPDAGNVRADYANSVDASGGIVYSVRTFNQDSSLALTSGYDLVTGIGVPNTGWLTAIS